MSQKKIELLALGLNFAITPKKFPLIEYITAAEKLCQSIKQIGDDESIEKAQQIRNSVLNQIRKGVGMKIKSNLNAEEHKLIKEITEDQTIIICPADKGKAIVIEDRETYLSKMQDQIDEGDYELNGRKEKTILDKLHKKLTTQLKIMDIDLDDKKERYKYLSSAPVLANMYLLIKVHKKNFPGRAVVNQTDDPTYKICKILTNILNPLAIQSKSYVENSFELKKILQSTVIEPGYIQASFDVKSLYPSIPIEKTLEITKQRLYADESLHERTKWKPDDIVELLKICVETHFKTLDGRIFTQTDGTPIGKSISGPLADIYMDWFERTYIYSEHNEFKNHLKIWKRSRDDVYILWSGGQEALDCFFWRVNYIDPRIQFTIEREKEAILPFLDISIKRYPNQLETKVYRKETHTQRYIHWRSNHSRNCKLGILKGLIHRAHLLCDRKEDPLDEIQLLKVVFIANGCPNNLVQRTVRDSWKIELEK